MQRYNNSCFFKVFISIFFSHKMVSLLDYLLQRYEMNAALSTDCGVLTQMVNRNMLMSSVLRFSKRGA